MKLTVSGLLFSFLIPTTLATVHTTCYNFFLKKDGCVFSAADNRNRCGADVKHPPKAVCQFDFHNSASARLMKRDEPMSRLQRRYDATNGVYPILHSRKVCGEYDTHTDHGACLWHGTTSTGDDPSQAGWLNEAKTSNCRKQLYVQRQGQPETVLYVPVLDACSFDTFDPNSGCFQIALTEATFNALKPTEAERHARAINGITWDFNNLNGDKTKNAPV